MIEDLETPYAKKPKSMFLPERSLNQEELEVSIV